MEILKNIKIGVIYGGDSPEREVSLASGTAVVKALKELDLDVEPFLVSSALEAVSEVKSSEREVFFIALHGGWGEDGRLQGALDLLGRKYTGSGHESCALAMDKRVSKAIFESCKIPTAPYAVLKTDNFPQDLNQKLEELLCLWKTVVVKPSGGGSTVGVTIAHDAETIWKGIHDASLYDQVLLIEKYIPGREITVTVWEEEGKVTALPIVEIIPKEGFYDYKAKYTPGTTKYQCPADLPEEVGTRVKEAAVASHLALGCRVYSRVDIRLSEDGTPYVLEVNTAPGMTATSLVPKASAAMGWSFSDLVAKIVINSLKKYK